MSLGERIRERARLLGISQAEVGRRADVAQSTINTLVNSNARTTPHLIRLARVLETSPAYLMGETDDPDENAPPPPPPSAPPMIMMPVSLPSENALADMFEGLLLTIHEFQPIKGWELDELGRELAQLLPTGLSQLQGRLIELPRPPRARSRSAGAPADPEAVSSNDRELQR